MVCRRKRLGKRVRVRFGMKEVNGGKNGIGSWPKIIPPDRWWQQWKPSI